MAGLSIACRGGDGPDGRGTRPESGSEAVPLAEGAWRPEPGQPWHVQYAGDLAVPDGVEVVNLDMEETSGEVISDLQGQGIRVVCYLSAGSWEPYRADADDFPDEILGDAYEGFEDERWLDIRSSELRPLLAARITRAVEKGCDAIDPDNVNGFENETGFPLTVEDQITFNRWLFDEVHRAGVAVGLKNGLSQVDELIGWVEFQVNEECIEQDDCRALEPFVAANKPVYSIEYAGDPGEVCTEAARLGFATVIKDLDLGPDGHACPVG